MPLIEIYRAKIDPADVGRLMEIRADAVAEFRRQVPELLQADLVRLEGDVWLDVLTWSAPVDEQRISEAASAAPKSAEMHSLITEVLGHDRGELMHSSGRS
jgi:hypothetical protein